MNPELRSTESMWLAFDNGASLGQKGSEQGMIVRDEEHRLGARITLERDGCIAPFSITCGIYGLFVHTAFAADEPEAVRKYDAMKVCLEKIITADQQDVPSQLHDFVNAF